MSRSWQQTLYGHLALARVSNSPTVVSNTLAGAALAGALRLDGPMCLVAIAMVLFYTAGMYLNDLLDYAIDCRERAERPLPAGIVSRSTAAAVVIVLLGSGSMLLWSVGLRPFLSGLVLIALIICYDRWHKSNPLSPLLMALCRVMVYVTAFLAFSSQSLFNLLIPGCLLMLYVIGLTCIAKRENKPIVALAEFGEELRGQGGSKPQQGGGKPRPYYTRAWRAASSYSRGGACPRPASGSAMNVGILATLFLPGVYFVTRLPLFSLQYQGGASPAPTLLYFVTRLPLFSLPLILLFTAWVGYSISFTYRSQKRQIGRTIGQLIAGISLLDSLVLAASGSVLGTAFALVAFGLTLYLQRYVRGT